MKLNKLEAVIALSTSVIALSLGTLGIAKAFAPEPYHPLALEYAECVGYDDGTNDSLAKTARGMSATVCEANNPQWKQQLENMSEQERYIVETDSFVLTGTCLN